MTAFALVILLFYLGLTARTMKHNTLFKWLLAACAALLIVVLLSVKGCVDAKSKYEAEKHAHDNTKNSFSIERNKLGQLIATQDVNLGTQKDLYAVLHSDYKALSDKYRKIQSTLRVNAQVDLGGVKIKYDTIVRHKTDTSFIEGDNCIPVGTVATIDSPYYEIQALVDTNAIRILKFVAPVDYAVVWGQPKDKFIKRVFNPSQPTVSVMFTSPYVQVKDVSNGQAPKPKKRIGLKIVTHVIAFGLGFFAGISAGN